MVTVVLPLPVAFVAVMVYVVDAFVAVGVPEITPVDVLNDKPEGNDPPAVMAQLVAAPPVLAGVRELIVAPTEYVFVDGV